MKKILNKYCNTENEKGLLLFNPPTGTGKTYEVLQWIYNNYKTVNRKIFFVTNLKKNLPHDELKKLFEKDNNIEEFDKNVLFINSNIEFVLQNFSTVSNEIGKNFRDKNFNILKKRIETITNEKINQYFKEIVDTSREEVRKSLEPKFREKITKYLKENYPNKRERLFQIKNNKELQWIGKLYPSVFTSKAKIFFLSIDKFFTKNTTLVEPSYYFIENDITKNAVVFIDEFDATKERVLQKIIEQATSQKVDYIDLFNKINWSLSNNELPNKILTNSAKRQDEVDKNNKYVRNIENIEDTLKERAKKIVDEYNVQYSFKTEETQTNSRNLLFQDFKYHSVYRNGNYIRLWTDKNDKVNHLSFVEKQPKKSDPNIVVMLNQIKGFLKTFQGVIKDLATNYAELENEQRKENDIEYTFDLALSSIIEEYRLENRYKRFIIDSILSNRQTKTNNIINYDFTIYENGFRYYDFVDDEQHNTITKIYIYNFENTPEKFLLKLAEKSFVVGISATANIETVTGNYDLEYLKRQLGDNYFELTEQEKNNLKTIFNERNQNYNKQVKIHTKWIGTNNIKTSFEEIFENEELASEILQKLPDEIDKPLKDQYNNIRIYRIAKVFKEFLIQDDIKGFLCLLTKKPKERDYNLDLNLLNEIFDILIKDVTKKQDLFEKIDNKYDAYVVVDSLEFEENKTKFQNQLENGKKVFVLSMYQTLGAGQNLQFKAPNPDKLIDVSNGTVKWNSEQKTDFNAIYLDQPTHLIQLVNKTLNEEGFIKYLFQLEFLLEAGIISTQQLYLELKNAFQFLLAKNSSNIYNKRIDLYNNKNIRQHFSKHIIQAIGRICRTNLKMPNIYIYADDRIEKYISDFDIKNNLVLNEFAELVKSSKKQKIIDNSEKHLLNKANNTNKKINNYIKRFIQRKDEWKWTTKQINDWKQLREQSLKHPTLTEDEAKLLANFINLYIELPKNNNQIYFQQSEDYNKVEISFNSGLSQSVSQESARLNDIFHIPNVKKIFEENNYATEFKLSKYIIPPQLFNNIYKGALGETVGKIIFEHHLDIQLEELNEDNFELFDYKVKDTDIYIDFKHWKDSTRIDENKIEILRKLSTVKGSIVIIINILSKQNYKPYNTIDNKIIQIPGLWDIDNRKFISKNIKKINDEIK